MKILHLLSAALLAAFVSCSTVTPEPDPLPRAMLLSVRVDAKQVPDGGSVSDISQLPQIRLEFSRNVTLDEVSVAGFSFSGGALKGEADAGDPTVIVLRTAEKLSPCTKYRLAIPAGETFGVDLIEGFSLSFVTAYDISDKFPRISREELLTKVQERTFSYFWDYAHPVSGLARERLGSDDTVTSGGSGFGIMALPVGVERGFVTREQAAERLRTIVGFLGTKADRFHGAFSHWLNGSTGKVIPFSAKDNGGDLIETAFLIEGLLAAAGYFDRPEEKDIRDGIDAIWRDVEWDWYTRGGQDALYWHWSPDNGWAMNMQINGWNEGLIAYVLAAASPTHPVPASAYHKGWARDGGIRNGRTFWGFTLPLGSDRGGPMFFAHYSFMGLDPRGLKDRYADYWEQNVAHARINHAYCEANPNHHAGYNGGCWGLTASDYPRGYTASSPSNDTGTIAPTAALASMPYTPEESLAAMETFYYIYGDRLWGEYGFYDAFCLDSVWFAKSYIAIDQGPIVVMIENYRSGLLWDCFMKHPDLPAGLEKLGFGS